MSDTKKFPPVSHLADNPRYNPKRKRDGGDGGGPTMNDLTPRVENLERDVSDIKVTLARIEGRFDTFGAKFDSMNTKLNTFATKTEMAQMETRVIKWSVGTILAAGGLVFAIMRFLPSAA